MGAQYGIIGGMNCACGCGRSAGTGKRYVSGHNLRGLEKTATHRARIGEGQRRAWATKRKRMPIGATWIDASGYVRVKVVLGAGRWRLEHVMVMERMIGRSLRKGEIVHHINGVRTDNRETNLFLCRSHSHHMAVERSLVATFRALLEAGAARFNSETGAYETVLR